jgi:hypothetical protein
MEIIEAILAISNKEDQKDTHIGSDTDNCRLVVAYSSGICLFEQNFKITIGPN